MAKPDALSVCLTDGVQIFSKYCLPIGSSLISGLVVLGIMLILFSYMKKFLLNTKHDENEDSHSSKFSYASYKPIKPDDLKSITVHELGHALVALNFPTLYKDGFLQIFDKELENLRHGYAYYSFNSNVKDTSLTILEIKMLILLGGMQAEKCYYAGNCLVGGAMRDLDQWMRIARTYFINNEDEIFYDNPQNMFEQQHNQDVLLNLRKDQIRILSEFFNANSELFLSLVDSTMESTHLSFLELMKISKKIIRTKDMPFEEVKE